jgi:hypothetical protein
MRARRKKKARIGQTKRKTPKSHSAGNVATIPMRRAPRSSGRRPAS